MVTTSSHNSRSNHNSNSDVSSGPEAARSNTARRNDRTYVKLLWFGLLVASAAATLATLVYLYERGERARLAARMTKLSAEGAPIDDASLAKIYQARTSGEMLEQWSKVFALARQIEDLKISGDEKEAELRLPALRDEVAVAVNADLPTRFIEKFEATYTLLPYLSRLRTTTKLLASHARAAISDDQVELAVEDCELMQGCSDAIAADPYVIPSLVSNHMQSEALEIYREGLKQDLLSEAQLSTILTTCRTRGAIGDRWRVAISGERAGVLALLTDAAHEESLAVEDRNFHWLGLRGKGANNMTDLFEKLEAVPVENLQLMHSELVSIQADWDRSVKKNILASFDNRLSTGLVCDFQRVGNSFICLSMKYRMTAVAVGLRLYEKKFGEFPQSLEQLLRVGMEASDLRTLSNANVEYLRTPSNARLFDDDASWHPAPTVNSPQGEAEWEWTLDAK